MNYNEDLKCFNSFCENVEVEENNNFDHDTQECDELEHEGVEILESVNNQKSVKLQGENLDNFLSKMVEEYQLGLSEAFNEVYNHYKPILERLSFRQGNEDLIQELGLVLFRAMQTFQVDKGAKFNTYFWKCAQNQLGALNTYNRAKKRTAENGTVSIQQNYNSDKNEVQLETFLEDSEASKFQNDSAFKIALRDEIYPFLKIDEIKACEMIQEGYTLEEIGEALGGITAPAVHVKFRRLAKKKNIGKKLRNLYDENE